MAYNFSKKSLERLEGIHPLLVKVFKEAIKESPFDFLITQGVRTEEEQNRLYQQGRTKPGKKVTNCDGTIKKSNHQAKKDGFGYAIDIAIYNPNIPGKVEWDANKLRIVANHIKEVARKLDVKVEWGGDWRSFKDYPHFELKL
ncbi:M15 family metallopeptidase [Streptobacillus canis]|uniref:M15 family metallopeptidase n=1 Tax=Streptobacillus canis TaxID=2678686 RepID=UPI0012E105AD|nr:M15 family metallopeptidase [Streptobacillus canis]